MVTPQCCKDYNEPNSVSLRLEVEIDKNLLQGKREMKFNIPNCDEVIRLLKIVYSGYWKIEDKTWGDNMGGRADYLPTTTLTFTPIQS